MTQTDIALDSIELLEFERACETPDNCDSPATFLVWCDHHIQGCEYQGYRCEVHRNMLESETRKLIIALKSGQEYMCGTCEKKITGTNLSDHLKWIRL